MKKLAVIACSLDATGLSDRRDRWLRLWSAAGVEALTIEGGLRLRFRKAPGVEQELRGLAELERECCAFADWSVQDSDDKVALDVTADRPDGVDAVRAIFQKLR